MTPPPDAADNSALEDFRRVAAFAGLHLSDARLAELRPLVENARLGAAWLDGAELRTVEPAVTAPPLTEDE
ncbi:MAG: hypothetical protein NTZ05_07400 [Chloroflexi bacterium]|nr:hypothetical protein [Chloroflexota bacterium]